VVERLPGRPGVIEFAVGGALGSLANGAYDDIVYLGADAGTAEALFPRLAPGGLMAIVRGGQKFGRPVDAEVGRVHYGGIRVIGTAGADPAEAYAAIPANAEIGTGDRINIVGAAGPMGTMHVIRLLSSGTAGVTVYAGDLNEERLAGLRGLAEPLAREKRVGLHCYNPKKDSLAPGFDYVVILAPVAALVAEAVEAAAKGGVINVFAGIPADKTAAIDLDAYVEKELYFIGTSGSEISDMRQVLAKLTAGELDTNLSVAAVAGLEGAIDGIRAVEKNLLPGKVLVYPSCRGLELTPLGELKGVATSRWDAEAEAALLKSFETP